MWNSKYIDIPTPSNPLHPVANKCSSWCKLRLVGKYTNPVIWTAGCVDATLLINNEKN